MGQVRVTVQKENRLRAINNLSIAVRKVAEALAYQTKVEISDCTISHVDTGIVVDTNDDVLETKIEKLCGDKQ